MSEYIVFSGDKCPYCNGRHIDIDEFPIYINEERVIVPQYCHACGTTWNACYKFTHNEEIDVLDVAKEKYANKEEA